eukprot:6184890-Pleurochrysis_carterae.AAC.2
MVPIKVIPNVYRCAKKPTTQNMRQPIGQCRELAPKRELQPVCAPLWTLRLSIFSTSQSVIAWHSPTHLLRIYNTRLSCFQSAPGTA